MEVVSTGLSTKTSEYMILSMPVMIVLQDEYLKVVLNTTTLEENIVSEDLDAVIYRNKIELSVNSTQIMSTERRVQAKRAQAKAMSLALKLMRDENIVT